MPTTMTQDVRDALNAAMERPCLATARGLEDQLARQGYGRNVFGRLNQKSSIEAASESDRGIVERLANALDASLTSARHLAGLSAGRDLTPRKCAKRLFCAKSEECEWNPVDSRIACIGRPAIEFWGERGDARQRFRRYNPGDGLAAVLVQDHGVGITREDMPRTILDLNSESKLRVFEAIGQFGQGGSCSLAFCESCLVVTKPRSESASDDFYWTLITTEREAEESKQDLIRRWFCDQDGLPLFGSVKEFPELRDALPGTSVWHYGYRRGGWIARIAGPEQTNPWGRLGRLFFSYPLPFEIRGEFARTDTKSGRRNIKGAYFRLGEEREKVAYRSGEKSEDLIVEGNPYGQFSLFVFILHEKGGVRDYVYYKHPVLLTLNGQNHGEMTETVLVKANLPELASSCIVEVRLDGLDREALNEIVSNSRETPKNTVFTRTLRDRLEVLLAEDETLQRLERERQEAKAKQSSAELNQKITKFLSAILSDAVAQPTGRGKGKGPGKSGKARVPRPEIPEADPPKILEFLHDRRFVPEGTTMLAKFKSDARPPKYTFHGDNPRCFARLEVSGPFASRLAIVGRADIDSRGYGSISLHCMEDPKAPIPEELRTGELFVTIQSTDGRLLQAKLPVGVRPKPEEKETKRAQAVQTEIIFVAPDDANHDSLKQLIREDKITPFSSCTYLEKYRDALAVPPALCTYWGARMERDGVSILQVEINAAHPQLVRALQGCDTAEDTVRLKELYVRDVVLDCYQHCFRLEDMPEMVTVAVEAESDDAKRAAEIHLNHDKALRIATNELRSSRTQ